MFKKWIVTVVLVALSIAADAQQATRPDLTKLKGLRIGEQCKDLFPEYQGPVTLGVFANVRASADQACQKTIDNADNSGPGFINKFWVKDELVYIHYTPEGRAWQIGTGVYYETNKIEGPTSSAFFDAVAERFGSPMLVDDILASQHVKEIRGNGGAAAAADGSDPGRTAYWASEGAPWRGAVNIWDDFDIGCRESSCLIAFGARSEARVSQLRGYVTKMQVGVKRGRITYFFTTLTDPTIEATWKNAKAKQERQEDRARVPKF